MTKQELIDKLNEDLADELGAIIQYVVYSARATGPFRPQLSQFFQAEIADEQVHAQFLANKICSLGGTPTTTPRPVPLPDGNRAMLEEVAVGGGAHPGGRRFRRNRGLPAAHRSRPRRHRNRHRVDSCRRGGRGHSGVRAAGRRGLTARPANAMISAA